MSILATEINDQPAAIRNLLEKQAEIVFQELPRLSERFDSILIAARGTSDNAARYAQYLFGAQNSLPVGLATPSLYTLYNRPPLLKRMLVIGISQSGQSPDIVAVLADARRQNQPTLAITNVPASPLAQVADLIIPLLDGPERAVAATKTYTASLAALALISAGLGQDRERLDQLFQAPDLMQHTLDTSWALMPRAERYRYMDRCVVIGRGYNYATAFEVALKIKELTGVVAESYSSADFRHGPIAIVRNGFPVIVVAPSGDTANDLADMVQALRRRNAELLVISDQPDLLNQADLALPIPGRVPEWLTPILAVLPGQCLGLALTVARHLDPDKPSGLTKITETF